MSIHDFHSKLMSGKEEGTLFEALRSLRSIGGPSIWKAEGTVEPGGCVWREEGETKRWTFLSEGTLEGWAVWQDGSFGPPAEA